jgi:drug/metabolite transporter (DMT)-like permease
MASVLAPSRPLAAPRWLLIAMVLGAPALFAANMVAGRWAHDAGLPPVFLAFGRWAIALLLLVPFIARRAWAQRHLLRGAAPQLLALASLGMGVAVAPQYIGAQTTSATNIGLIFSISPMLVLALEAGVWGVKIDRRQAFGLVLALAGVLVVLTRGDLHALLRLSFGKGDLWVLLAASGWALYTVLLRHSPLPQIDQGVRLGALMAGGVLVLAPFASVEAIVDGLPAFGDPRLAMTLAFLALVPSLGAYMVFGKLVAEAGPAVAGASMFLVPLYAALLAWPLLGETPHLYHLTGMLLILPGMRLATARAARSPSPALPRTSRSPTGRSAPLP